MISKLTDAEIASGAPPKQSAYVSAVFRLANGGETKFTRAIKASGESEYRVDNKIVGASDYEARLGKMGILVEANNFLVFQGDVEKTAAMKPIDLTAMLEVVSGSGALKSDYDKKLQEVNKAKDSVTFNFFKKKGVGAQKTQLKAQSDEAKKYLSLREQRDDLRVEINLLDLYYIQLEKDDSLSKKTTETRNLEVLEMKRKALDELVRDKVKEQSKHQKDMLTADKKIAKVEQDIQQLKPKQIKQKEEIAHLNKRLTTMKSSQQVIQDQIDSTQTIIADLNRQLSDITAQCESYKKQVEESRRENHDLALLQSQLDNYNSIREQVTATITNEQQQLDTLQRSHRKINDEIEAFKAQVESQKKSRNNCEEAVVGWVRRRQTVEENIKENVTLIARYEQELQTLAESQSAKALRLKELDNMLQMANSQLQQIKSVNRDRDRDARSNEAIFKMKKSIPGVYGKLFDLCKPTKAKFNLAVTVALGKNMDAIVVENQSVAQTCLEYLKENKVGVYTFLPLENLKAKEIDNDLRKLNCRLVYDVITPENANVQKAVLFAVGNTLLCEDVDAARAIAYSGQGRYKIVTLDGTLFAKSGIITGGISGIDSKSQRWDDRTVDEIKRKRDAYHKEMAELGSGDLNSRKNDKQPELNEKINNLKEKNNYLRSDITMSSGKITENEKQIANIDAWLAESDAVLESKLAEARQVEAQIAELTRKIHAVEDQMFKAFVKEVGISNIREFENREGHEVLRKQSENMLNLNKQKTLLETKISFERGKNVAAPLQNLIAQIDEVEKRLTDIQNEQKKTNADADKHIAQLDEAKREKNKAKEKFDELETAMGENKKAFKENENGLIAVRKTLSTLESQLYSLTQKQYSLIQTCLVEDIPLPIVNGPVIKGEQVTDILRVDDDALKLALGLEPSSQVLPASNFGPDGIEFDFSQLPDSVKDAQTQKDRDELRAKYAENLKSIRVELEGMNPNLRAVEHLDDAKEKLAAATSELEEGRIAERKAALEFQEIKKRRIALFMEAFNKIAENVGPIYKELNKGMGSASIQLENIEEPYLGGIKFTAQPPQKRFREIELLSGGEQSVAALALLFAVHSFHPSPFFILDEVDAALDRENIANVASFIAKKSQNDFQCIVISLKDNFYDKASSLIGIYRENHVSKTLTLDLTAFDQ